MEEQPYPEASKCPECGGEPTDESKVHHRLSAVGYLHDDGSLKCSDCGETWSIGRPIGRFDGGDDLWCGSCDEGFMRVHRVQLVEDDHYKKYNLHLKCPNHSPFDCEACPATIFEPKRDSDGRIYCPACGHEYEPNDVPGCVHFKTIQRESDEDGLALVGYPDITGSMDGATDAYGYPEDEPPA